MRIPVVVGNAVGYDVTLEIMECGPAAVLVGVGPGAACTSRGVLGLGVPQVTATVDCAAARDAYFKKTSRYVPIITDGGMSKGRSEERRVGKACRSWDRRDSER